MAITSHESDRLGAGSGGGAAVDLPAESNTSSAQDSDYHYKLWQLRVQLYGMDSVQMSNGLMSSRVE